MGTKCSNCGVDNVDMAKFCKGCGTKIEVEVVAVPRAAGPPGGSKFCPKCGNANSVSSSFCRAQE